MGNEVYSLYELAIIMIKTGFKAICTNTELSYDAFDDYLAKNEIEAHCTQKEKENYCMFIHLDNVIANTDGSTKSYFGLDQFIQDLIYVIGELEEEEDRFEKALEFLDDFTINTKNELKAFALSYVKAEVYGYFFSDETLAYLEEEIKADYQCLINQYLSNKGVK